MKLLNKLSNLFTRNNLNNPDYYIAQRNALLAAKEDFYKANGGFINTFNTLYNFLNKNIDLSVNNYDLLTGIEFTSYTRNTVEFCTLVDDCMLLVEEHFVARYKTIHEYFESNTRYLGSWFDNSNLVSSGLEHMLDICKYYQHQVCLEHNSENSHEIDNTTYLNITGYTAMMDRKYPGLVTFVNSKDFVTLMNECTNILIALLEVKIRGFGGEETD